MDIWAFLIRGENPGAFPKAGPIFQQPFPLPENAQTLAGIALGAAGKSVKNFPAASKFARKRFRQGISDIHSLLEFSDQRPCGSKWRPQKKSVPFLFSDFFSVFDTSVRLRMQNDIVIQESSDFKM